MERRPHRQQHDLDRQHRHRAPAQHAVESEQEPREDVDAGRAAAAADRLARTRHVRRVDGITDHLQREIGFDAGAHVERAVLHQGPAAMVALRAAQIVGDLGFEGAVDGLGEIVAQQDIFRRYRAVGFQLEHPVPVGLPVTKQRFGRRRDALLQRDGVDCRDCRDGFACNCFVDGKHIASIPLFATGLCEAGHATNPSGLKASPGPDRRRGRPTVSILRWLPAIRYQSSRRRETGF